MIASKTWVPSPTYSYMSQPKHQLDTFRAWAGKSSDISYDLNSHHIDFHEWCVESACRPVRVTTCGSTGVAKDKFEIDACPCERWAGLSRVFRLPARHNRDDLVDHCHSGGWTAKLGRGSRPIAIVYGDHAQPCTPTASSESQQRVLFNNWLTSHTARLPLTDQRPTALPSRPRDGTHLPRPSSSSSLSSAQPPARQRPP
jgi:hypothetical protein